MVCPVVCRDQKEGTTRFELVTCGSAIRCSTTELCTRWFGGVRPGGYCTPPPNEVFLVGVVGNISACHADARGSIPRRGAFLEPSQLPGAGVDSLGSVPSTCHTLVKASHPVRSVKLSTSGSSQYCGGGPRRNPGCRLSLFAAPPERRSGGSRKSICQY